MEGDKAMKSYQKKALCSRRARGVQIKLKETGDYTRCEKIKEISWSEEMK